MKMDTSNQKQPLEMRRDSGISCFTPSPPPKKSSLPGPSGSTQTGHRELRRRLPSREKQRARSAGNPNAFTRQQVELPPKLDLRSLIGDDSDDDALSSETLSSGRTYQSDDCANAELAMAIETPSSNSNSRMSIEISTPDGYQSDNECSSTSPAVSNNSSPNTLGVCNLRRYGSGGLEEESEGSVLKVKLKLKSSHSDSSNGEEGQRVTSGKSSPHQTIIAGSTTTTKQKCHESTSEGSALSRYTPLPGIGHQSSNPIAAIPETDGKPEGKHSADIQGQQTVVHHLDEDIREQRLRALERSASHSELTVKKRVPVPPPQSAKTVSRREMRMQQFARRKSASHADAPSRKSSQASTQVSESVPSVLLALRLPTGRRVQNLFKSSDLLRTVVNFALQKESCSLDIDSVCLVTNDLPKKELTDLSVTIEHAGLKDRTLLHIQETD